MDPGIAQDPLRNVLGHVPGQGALHPFFPADVLKHQHQPTVFALGVQVTQEIVIDEVPLVSREPDFRVIIGHGDAVFLGPRHGLHDGSVLLASQEFPRMYRRRCSGG